MGVATRVGAGRLIQGDVVGTRQQITINAAILQAPDANVAARASVEGSPDSLPRLVDWLAGKLLALEAGEGEQRLASLTSTSLPALRAYLEGQALVRRGDFRHAADRFKSAIQQAFVDSGATLSHHHAVGTEHAQWLEEDISTPGVAMLRALFEGTDPGANLNPGKIVAADPDRRPGETLLGGERSKSNGRTGGPRRSLDARQSSEPRS